jgi:DNA-binding MarR family transcriptional regulator
MSQLGLPEFADRFEEIFPVVIREFARRQTSELYKGKISFPQFLALGFINGHGEARMTDMARYMSVSTAAMTGIVDRLVRDGYVVRAYDPEDRRTIRIKLTHKGASLVKKIKQQRRLAVMKVFGKISQAEREDYLRIFTRIHDILADEKNPRDSE